MKNITYKRKTKSRRQRKQKQKRQRTRRQRGGAMPGDAFATPVPKKDDGMSGYGEKPI